MVIKTDSFKKKYVFKLVTSFAGIPLNLLTALLIPRMLGPSLFGDYKYLIYSFTQVTSFFGTSNNFLAVGLAKNNYDKILISFYWTLLLVLVLAVSVLLIPVLHSTLCNIFFPGQNINYIWIAYFLVLFTFISQVLESMIDSCGLTTNGSIVNILAKLIGAAFLLLFFYSFHWRGIFPVFAIGYISTFFLVSGFSWMMVKRNIPVLHVKISLHDFKERFKSFYQYTEPLFILTIVGLPLSFLNRWMLQIFGGSLEQGYFSLSDSFSSFVIMFSNSFIPLLTREFAISFNNDDLSRMSSLFIKSLSFLFAISSFFSVFLLLNASDATLIVGGRSFEGAILPVSIMILYPIPYVINNILYAFIYSTNRTVLLRNVMLISSFVGVFVTFVLVAPTKYLGFNLGAAGFAISMVFNTSLIYLVLLKYCASALGVSWGKIMANHIIVLVLFLAEGIIAIKICELFIKDSLLLFFLSGFLYSAGVFLILLKFPKLLGVSIAEIYSLLIRKPKPVEEV